MLQDLTCENFGHCLNQVFRLSYDSGTLEVKLIECRKLDSHGRSQARREPFSLMFLGPKQPILPQRMYSFDFGQLGTLEIFIVPIGADELGVRYQAVFT
jgi:hypothetical protein